MTLEEIQNKLIQAIDEFDNDEELALQHGSQIEPVVEISPELLRKLRDLLSDRP